MLAEVKRTSLLLLSDNNVAKTFYGLVLSFRSFMPSLCLLSLSLSLRLQRDIKHKTYAEKKLFF
jgi:hypothetical protein